MNYSSDLKNLANSRSSASNFKISSRSLEQFFLTVVENNFGNKIPFFPDKQITLEARLWSSLEQMSIIDPLAMQSVFIVAKAKLLQ